MIFVAIATVVFTSCESKSGKREHTGHDFFVNSFKKIIEESTLDSSFMKSFKSIKVYDFYLPEYRITINTKDRINFEGPGQIEMYTRDINGKYVMPYCSYVYVYPEKRKTNEQKWTNDEQQEILNLLLAKKDKQSLPN